MIRYVFMGTPEFAASILSKLADKHGSPLAVFTQPPRESGRGQKVTPSAVQILSESKGWPCIPTENINLESEMNRLTALRPDLILVAAFGQILKKPILELPKYCLNVHASLLPKYRGAAPIQRAILNGERETGITIQKMARKLDTGDILLQKKIPILKQETSGQLHERLSELGASALIEAVRTIEAGQETFQPQDETQATHAAKLTKEEAKIDWSLPAPLLQCKVYGLQPWPVAETLLGTDALRIFGAQALDATLPPGQIATDGKTFLHVGCGSGTLALTEIQLANRKRLSVVDFLKGYRGNFPFKHVGPG